MGIKFFAFSAMGNFSETHGWDNGLSTYSLGQELNLEELQEEQHDQDNKCPWAFISHSDSFGGSRNISGVIVAESREKAEKLLRAYAESWPTQDYEG